MYNHDDLIYAVVSIAAVILVIAIGYLTGVSRGLDLVVRTYFF